MSVSALCCCVAVGPGEESPAAGRQGGGGAAEGPDQRPAGEEPAAGEREPHPQSPDTHSPQHTLMVQNTETTSLTRWSSNSDPLRPVTHV